MFKNGQIVTIISEKEANERGLYFESYLTELQGEELVLRIDNDRYSLEYIDGKLVEDECGNIVNIDASLLTGVENAKVKELKIGDRVTFLDVLSPFKRYGETIMSMYMSSFKGRQCTISHINEDNTFKIEEDGKGLAFSRGMIKEYTSVKKDIVVNLEYLRGQDIAIHCKTLDEGKKLFSILNNLGVTWCDGDDLIWDNEWENIFINEDCFSLSKDGDMEYCNEEWYWNNGFRVVNMSDVKFVEK